MILSVAWMGQVPRVGEWVRSDHAGWSYEIVRIARIGAETKEARAGRSLRLEVQRRPTSERPSSVKLHPYSAMRQTEIGGPPDVRQSSTFGKNQVMRDVWSDPSDVGVSTRVPKQVTGFRARCPLARYLKQRNTSQISSQHVAAAERLRRDADHALHGFSAGVDLGEALFHAAGPRTGFSPLAVAQATALDHYRGAMAILSNDNARHMIIFIVIERNSVAAWTKKQTEHSGRRYDEKVELGRLAGMLDQLVTHYGQDLEDDIRTGEVLLPMAASA